MLLAWLNERYPFTQFHISRQIYMGVWDSLLYEGFHWLSASREPRRWQIPLVLIPGSVQWRFVMAADHPLANVEEPLTEAQLRRFPAVNIEDSARTLTKRVARRLPGQRDYCSRYGTKIAAHLAGVGIGFAKITLPVNAR